jgi:uncharacterized protein (TIGR03000 family)
MGALIVATAGSAQAQHHGGGGGGHFGGGGHYGGAHFGGYHSGGYHSGGYYGGYHDHPYAGYHNYYGHYGNRFYYPYYGGYPYAYGSVPYYGYYGYYPSAVYDAPSYWSGSAEVPDYTGFYGDSTPPYTGGYAWGDQAPATTVTPNAGVAHITLTVPDNAVVSFDGLQTTSTGPVRNFETPPLSPGRYSYHVQAHWQQDGHTVTQQKQVFVSPGASVQLDFPIPHADPARTSAAK